MYLVRTFWVFRFKLNYSILCQCHIIELKLSEKPYKIFEVENLIEFLNGKTEMEHVAFAKNLY